MDTNEIRSLQEAYLEVVEGQQLDEAMLPGERQRKMSAKRHDPYATSRDRGTAHNIAVRGDVSTGDPAIKSRGGGGVKKDKGMGYGDRGAGNKARRRMGQEPLRGTTRREEVDIYDIILSHLIDEGYADTVESAEGIMVNMSEEWRDDIMEISQKTATRAYAQRATNEFETDGDNPRDFTKSGKSKGEEMHRRIKNKFGKKAGRHANRAAHANTFGRDSGWMPKKP